MRPATAILVLPILILTVGCGEQDEPTAVPPVDAGPSEPVPREWEVVSVPEAQARLAAGTEGRLELISKRSMQAEVIRWRAGPASDAVTELHSVVYYALEGMGTLHVGQDTVMLSEGGAVFVRGREERVFHALDADEDTFVLALYVSGRPALDDPPWAYFSGAELVEPKKSGSNVLHRVLVASTMTLGMFLLPRELSGDLLARHAVDEMKFVIFGGASIDAGPDIIPIEAGSLVFIDGSVAHRFTRIWRDLEVLFVWER